MIKNLVLLSLVLSVVILAGCEKQGKIYPKFKIGDIVRLKVDNSTGMIMEWYSAPYVGDSSKYPRYYIRISPYKHIYAYEFELEDYDRKMCVCEEKE